MSKRRVAICIAFIVPCCSNEDCECNKDSIDAGGTDSDSLIDTGSVSHLK